MMKLWTNFICLLLIVAACQRDATLTEETDLSDEIPSSLPKQQLPLEDLSAFAEPGTDGKIVGNAYAALEGEAKLSVKEGTGVLLLTGSNAAKRQVATQLQHQDLEMDLQFLLPPGGEAQLWLQGRYAIQLQDTWKQAGKRTGLLLGPTAAEDQAPPVNASRAPGLWQHLSLYFEAPRFDESGNKQSHAKLHYLKLNGYTLFEGVEWTGPSKSASSSEEVAEAALVLASLAGEAAFRDMQYKAYTLDKLEVNNLQYKVYQGDWDQLPKLDTMTVSDSGARENFEVELEGLTDKYALAFSGQLVVPVAGQYLFETQIDDGGDLWIDGELIVHNDGEPGLGTERGLVELSEGTHAIEVTYYQDVWGKRLRIFYEGPSIKRQALAAKAVAPSGRGRRKQLVVNPTEAPELIRSFINHKGVKRNFPISVGSPVGIHFAYDLEEGSLLHGWRGEFANVTNMWVGRGQSQLLIPGNASVQTTAGVAVASLATLDAPWPQELPEGYQMEGYDLDADGYPIFIYQFDGLHFKDQILPTNDGHLERQLEVTSGQAGAKHYFRLAKGQIDALESGWYRIDGEYYIDVAEAVVGGEQKDQLLVPLEGKKSVSYSLIW